jgi:hypothetical protein
MDELRLEMKQARDSKISSWIDAVSRKIDNFHAQNNKV